MLRAQASVLKMSYISTHMSCHQPEKENICPSFRDNGPDYLNGQSIHLKLREMLLIMKVGSVQMGQHFMVAQWIAKRQRKIYKLILLRRNNIEETKKYLILNTLLTLNFLLSFFWSVFYSIPLKRLTLSDFSTKAVKAISPTKQVSLSQLNMESVQFQTFRCWNVLTALLVISGKRQVLLMPFT